VQTIGFIVSWKLGREEKNMILLSRSVKNFGAQKDTTSFFSSINFREVEGN